MKYPHLKSALFYLYGKTVKNKSDIKNLCIELLFNADMIPKYSLMSNLLHHYLPPKDSVICTNKD